MMPVNEFNYDLRGKRVWVAGHRGMVGAALLRRLAREGCEILTAGREQADLREQSAVSALMARLRPHAVIVAAATVGGIMANSTRPAEFLFDNLAIATNVIDAAYRHGAERLLYLGSSCIYPREAAQPIAEEALLTGPLEPTNEWYAVAKIAGIKLCQAYRLQYGCDFISAMPTNLYGPGDNYDLLGSHVVPALLRKADDARRAHAASMIVWGSGTPRREFLHVDDCADAIVLLLRRYSGATHINIGSGTDITIAELARMVADVVGFHGDVAFDTSKPDGMPRKLMSADRMLGFGWAPRIGLRDGLADAYACYLNEHALT
jgi:GDP-L-fucose synthase